MKCNLGNKHIICLGVVSHLFVLHSCTPSQYIPMDEGRVRALSGNALFAYELPSPTSCHSSELRSTTRSAKDRHVFTHIQRSTYHSTPCLRGLFCDVLSPFYQIN